MRFGSILALFENELWKKNKMYRTVELHVDERQKRNTVDVE